MAKDEQVPPPSSPPPTVRVALGEATLPAHETPVAVISVITCQSGQTYLQGPIDNLPGCAHLLLEGLRVVHILLSQFIKMPPSPIIQVPPGTRLPKGNGH